MSVDELYPQSCPFCIIAASYPAPESALDSNLPPSSSASKVSRHEANTDIAEQLLRAIPEAVDIRKVDPNCCLVLSAANVLAFLDIMPLTTGHLLVISREHREKVGDLRGSESSDLGFWLPILARAVVKVTGSNAYNVIANNGAQAAQVVPHVHFHIIPRPEIVPENKNRNWSMFGRGQREDLDEDEGEKIAAELRVEVRKDIERGLRERSLI